MDAGDYVSVRDGSRTASMQASLIQAERRAPTDILQSAQQMKAGRIILRNMLNFGSFSKAVEGGRDSESKP